MPSLDVYNTPHEKQIDQIFLTKFQDWKYENEWRIVDHDVGEGLQEYPASLLKVVIFGVNTSHRMRAAVRQWVERRGHCVQFVECLRDEKAFKLHLRNLNDA